MDEYHRAMSSENKIRSARERPVMQPIAQSPVMQETPDQHFRQRVLPRIPDIIRDLTCGVTTSTMAVIIPVRL
jgi:hypothetical protein